MNVGASAAFTTDDFDSVVRAVADVWRDGFDRDWTAKAGTLDWDCTETAEHLIDAVLAVAFFLASRKVDGYPEWGWSAPIVGDDGSGPAQLVEAVETIGRIVVAVIVAAEPEARAVIWRRPEVEVRGPEDFAPRAGLEMILHAHDVCAGLGLTFDPPAAVCARLRDHTRGWPHWTAPGWSQPSHTDDPWGDLLSASGRVDTRIRT